LKLGALSGAAAGALLAAFLLVVGEQSINDAIALEHQRATASGEVHTEMFSRTVQHIGGGVGALFYGLCVGVLFSVVFAACRHRLAGDDWRRAVQLAAIGFVTVFLVPFCKYPANPPAVGDPATITRRTVLYLVMLAWSVVATLAAWRMVVWLRDLRRWDRSLFVPAAIAVYASIVGIGFVLLPGNPDRVTVPATLLWRFRLATVGGSVTFWVGLGLLFGALAVRPARQHARRTALT
jgi:hypothetical protein